GPPARPPGPQVRRGEDGAARPPRARLLARRGWAARTAVAHRLGDDPVVRTRVRPPSEGRMTFDGALVPVPGGPRGPGRAIAARSAPPGPPRVAIGYMRGDKPAEETAGELRALGAEP